MLATSVAVVARSDASAAPEERGLARGAGIETPALNLGPVQVGSVEVGPEQVSIGPVQVGPVEVGPVEVPDATVPDVPDAPAPDVPADPPSAPAPEPTPTPTPTPTAAEPRAAAVESSPATGGGTTESDAGQGEGAPARRGATRKASPRGAAPRKPTRPARRQRKRGGSVVVDDRDETRLVAATIEETGDARRGDAGDDAGDEAALRPPVVPTATTPGIGALDIALAIVLVLAAAMAGFAIPDLRARASRN